MIIPQAYLCEEQESALLLQSRDRDSPSIAVGTGLVISRGSAGAAVTAIIPTHHLAGDIRDRVNQAMASTTDGLNPSNGSSLGGVVIQYRRTLDLITDGHLIIAWYWGKKVVSM